MKKYKYKGVIFDLDGTLRDFNLYPGIFELISALKEKKIKLAVLTNKPDASARKVITELFPPGSFNIIRGEMYDKPAKPDPSCVWELLVELDLTPSDVIFVGDSATDMECAVLSGCFPLGVSWGYSVPEMLEKYGAKKIIDKPLDLLDFFN